MHEPNDRARQIHQTTQVSAEERERELAIARAVGRRLQLVADPPHRADAHAVGLRHSLAVHAFATLADNVRDYAIFLVDADGIITFWGEGARLIKWWTSDEAEGAHLRLMYPANGSEDGTAEAHLRRAAETGEYTGEGTRVRRDGSTFWAGITLTALRNQDGELVGFAKVTRNLTAHRAADALLQAAAASSDAAREAAESASAAKSSFLATMSHEIRTPIHAIMGYQQLLAMELEGGLSAGQHKLLERASGSARHLLQLITHVLDFSSAEAERERRNPEVVRLGDAVSESVSLTENQARGRDVSLVDAVSGFAAPIAAYGDPVRVRQILVNLLSNAIKFTDRIPGDTSGRVTISVGTALAPPPDAQLEGEGPWVFVRVEDTGTGIPANQLQAIFEAFVQADMSFTRVHEGVGLGLAICRRLARSMGGDVTVRSEVGLGSSFLLWLPAAPMESLPLAGLAGLNDLRTTASGDALSDTAAEEDTLSAPSSAVANVGVAILLELEEVLQRYVSRIRTDAETASARGMAAVDIEDNLATFLADIGAAIRLVSSALPGGPAKSGHLAEGLQDSTAIQQLISVRHGAQRARVGWRESEVKREFTILREELAEAVRRRLPQQLRARAAESVHDDVERAMHAMNTLLSIAEAKAVASYRQAVGGQQVEST